MASVFTPVFNATTGRFEPCPGNILYVDVDVVEGDDDGSSWANAFGNVNDAIDASTSGDRIYIAAGTYDENIMNADTKSLEFQAVGAVVWRTSGTKIFYSGLMNSCGLHGITFDAEDNASVTPCEFKGGEAVLNSCTFINTNTAKASLVVKISDTDVDALSLVANGCTFDRYISVATCNTVSITNSIFGAAAFIVATGNDDVEVKACSFGTSAAPINIGGSKVVDIINSETFLIDGCNAVVLAANTCYRVDPTLKSCTGTISNCSATYLANPGTEKYTFYIGNDTGDTFKVLDPVIENCSLHVPVDSTDSGTHGLFISDAISPIIRNNVSFGGGYTCSIKLCTDPQIYGNTFGEPAIQCLVDKACTRGRYYNNTLYASGSGVEAMRVVEGDSDEDVVDSRWYNNTVYIEDSAVAVQVDAGTIPIDQDYIITNPAPYLPMFSNDLPAGYYKNTMRNIVFYDNTYYVDTDAGNLTFTTEGVTGRTLAEVQAHPDAAKGYFWEAEGGTTVTVFVGPMM